MRKEILRELPKFVAEIQKMATQHVEKSSPILNERARAEGFRHGYYEISLDRITGRTKYARIVKTTRPGTSRSVHCFVNLENGDILKAASWKAPARHARGNIFDSNRLQAVGAYGANYLRANTKLNKGNPMSLRKELIKLAHSNPQIRQHILPLIQESIAKSAKRVQVVNRDTGKTVSVEESTLKDPEKKKLYAPLKGDGQQGGESSSGGSHAEWSKKVEKLKETISKNKEEYEEVSKKIEDAQAVKEEYEAKADERREGEWNIIYQMESSRGAQELYQLCKSEGESIPELDAERPSSSMLWDQMRDAAKKNDKIKKALEDYTNGSTYQNLSKRLQSLPDPDADGGLEKFMEADRFLTTDKIYDLVEEGGLEEMKKALEKQEKELSDLESNEPAKEEPKSKSKSKSAPKKKSRPKNEIQEDLDEAKKDVEKYQKEFESAEDDFSARAQNFERIVTEADLDIDYLDAGSPEQALESIKEWVDNMKNTYYDFDEGDATQAEKDEYSKIDDNWTEINDAFDEVEDYYEALTNAENDFAQAEKDQEEYEKELEEAGSSQGGGGKKKDLTKAEMKKKYEEAIKNSDMSADEKKKALEKAKDPNFDVEGALAGMGDDEEDEGGKKASLKSKIVRVAYANPTLRSRLVPLISGDKATPNLKSSLVRMAYENPELREHILPLIRK